MAENAVAVQDGINQLAERWSNEGQRRNAQSLNAQDFAQLHAAGYTRFGLPQSAGGLWAGTSETVAPICASLRALAAADPSVALVAAMHPLVLAYWNEGNPSQSVRVWNEQCDWIARTVIDGHWWGTLTSEPGSGGDIEQSKATTQHVEDLDYLVSGEKHFGSGSGITSYMITTARVEGFERAVTLFMDVRERPWENADKRFELRRAWDGYGMQATQSHAFVLRGYPARRIAEPAVVRQSRLSVAALGGCLFTSVVVGILDAAIHWSNSQLGPRREAMGAFQKNGWVDIQRQYWLALRAYEGMLRAVQDRGGDAARDALMGKFAVADLAENLLNDLARVASGSAFSRSQPLLQWTQDVRALGFLRPPWPLAVEQLFEMY